METIEVYLTLEDLQRLEQAKAELAKSDQHYAYMTVDEYISILLHHIANPDQKKSEDEL